MEPKTTSPTSARSSKRPSHRAFTLIELLVVIVIIAILAGVLLPMILKANTGAKKTRVAADLASIGVALDAYRADFGDYPRPDQDYTGFAVLGRALVSPGGVYTGPPAAPVPSAPAYAAGTTYQPGDCVSTGTPAEFVAITTTTASPPDPTWRPFGYTDGTVGPGFRARTGGKTYPAYLGDKFKMQGVALLDLFGGPILYYPARPGSVNLNAPGGFLSPTNASLYNIIHNPVSTPAALAVPNRPWIKSEDFARLMGDWTDANGNGLAEVAECNGTINAGETAAHTGPYILWSAGADGMFGIVNGKCDDVANFPLRNVPD